MKPVVAIVGRPNVGKSTLFNRLTRTHLAIVEDYPGVTRDRLYQDAEWNNQTFTLIDTGGIEVSSEDTILSRVRKQAQVAMEEADVIVFMCDIKAGVTNEDMEIAQMLRRTKKDVLLAVNKVENFDKLDDIYEFYQLGLGEPYPISASHGMNTGDLLDHLVELLGQYEGEDYEPDVIKIAVVGRPNVGKSSLTNAILGQERSIVSNIPGTTRDVIEEYINLNGIPLKIVDTAGIRETDNLVEQIGVDKAQQFMKNADLVLYVIDAVQGITEQDTEMLSQIQDRPVIYLVNKSDMGIDDSIRQQLASMLDKKTVLEISAQQKTGLEALEKSITDLFFAGALEVSNDILVTNVRHIQVLEECCAHLDGFLQGLLLGLSVDFLVIDLQNAWEKLGKITGETVEEDLLDQIFSKFCLGK